MKSLFFNFRTTRPLPVVTLCLTALFFSGCVDAIEREMERQIVSSLSFDGFLSTGGGYGGGYMPGVGLKIDTVIDIRSTSVVVNFRVIQQANEEVVILNGTRLLLDKMIGDKSTQTFRKFKTGPDTIDFRKKGAYEFQLTIDNLAPSTSYAIYGLQKGYVGKTTDSTSCFYPCLYRVQTKPW